MVIVGIGGKARHGKDSIANVLVDKFGYVRISVADPLKSILSQAFEIPLGYFYDGNLKDKDFDKPFVLTSQNLVMLENLLQEVTAANTDSLYDHIGKELKSPRVMMQYVGTDMCRKIDNNIWVNNFKKFLQRMPQDAAVVCADTRYPEERSVIKELGGWLFWVDRPNFETDVAVHESEQSYGDPDSYDVIFNNDKDLSKLESNVFSYINYMFPKKVFYGAK
jgi:hypothetical protein